MSVGREVVLSARDVSVKAASRQILRSVSLDLYEGEIVAVLGPSGAGKSTLFDSLMGLRRTSEQATIRLKKQDVTSLPVWARARAGVAYVPQGSSVLLDLTAHENLVTFSRLLGVVVNVDHALSEVGLEERKQVRAGMLSGGERRRLELARAGLGSPSVLLCDEPFAGVDPQGIEQIGILLQKWAGRGVAIALSDHHYRAALAVADKAALLVDGLLGKPTSAESFLTRADVIDQYLTEHQKSASRPIAT